LEYDALAKRCFRPLSHLTKYGLRQYGVSRTVVNTCAAVAVTESDRDGGALL
jgi:hypothetical protein